MMPAITDWPTVPPPVSGPTTTFVLDFKDEWDSDYAPTVRPERQQVKGAVTDEATPVEAASKWYAKLVRRIAELSNLRDKWIDGEADPPNETAASNARNVLAILEFVGAEPTHIGASTDEGICISFIRDGRYADIECYNSGDILAVKADRDSTPIVWTVREGELRGAVDEIARFIA